MRSDVKRSASSSYSEPSRRFHNLLYIPVESGYDSSSGVSATSSSTTLAPVEYIIYPIGLRQGQVRKLDEEYRRFEYIYKDILIRLEKLETLLYDSERVLDVTRISQVQEELRSVRTQLDEVLNLGQELVSKSEKYSKLVGPDIENISRKFEEIQHRIRIIQDRGVRERPEYEEIERIIRETEERAVIIERTDVVQAQRIREKIRQLKDCLETLRQRSDQYEGGDETFHFREKFSEQVRRTERVVPQREREFDSDFIFDVDDTRSVISEPAPVYNKYRKTVHSLERFRHDDQMRQVPMQEELQLQPLLRVRSLKAIDHRTLSAPSSPILQPRYRSYERSNVQYTKQSTNQQGQQNNYQSSISKSASMPNGGFPVQTNFLPHPPPPPPQFYPPAGQAMRYRERVIDKHVAERSTSRGESHREQRQESASQQHARSASASGNQQSQGYHLSIPVRFEESSSRSAGGAAGSAGGSGGGSGGATAAAAGRWMESSGFQTTAGPTQYYHENQQNHGGTHRQQQSYDQQMYTGQPVGRHPTRIVN